MPSATATRKEKFSILLLIALLACVAIHQARHRDAYPCAYAHGNPNLGHLTPKACATPSSSSAQHPMCLWEEKNATSSMASVSCPVPGYIPQPSPASSTPVAPKAKAFVAPYSVFEVEACMWQERTDYLYSAFHATMAAPSTEEQPNDIKEPLSTRSENETYMVVPSYGFTLAPPSEVTGARDLSHLPIYPTPKGYFALPGVTRAPRLTYINVTSLNFDVPKRAPAVIYLPPPPPKEIFIMVNKPQLLLAAPIAPPTPLLMLGAPPPLTFGPPSPPHTPTPAAMPFSELAINNTTVGRKELFLLSLLFAGVTALIIFSLAACIVMAYAFIYVLLSIDYDRVTDTTPTVLVATHTHKPDLVNEVPALAVVGDTVNEEKRLSISETAVQEEGEKKEGGKKKKKVNVFRRLSVSISEFKNARKNSRRSSSTSSASSSSTDTSTPTPTKKASFRLKNPFAKLSKRTSSASSEIMVVAT